MAQQLIALGAVPNDGTGDTLRSAGGKINANFAELFGRSTKLITFTRDLAAAAGPVTYEGVGFRPRWLMIQAVIDGTGRAGTGFADGSGDGASVVDLGAAYTLPHPFVMGPDGGNFQTAAVESYDTDGFTLNWSKIGAPGGTATFHVLCFA